jgi:hypothetical protein
MKGGPRRRRRRAPTRAGPTARAGCGQKVSGDPQAPRSLAQAVRGVGWQRVTARQGERSGILGLAHSDQDLAVCLESAGFWTLSRSLLIRSGWRGGCGHGGAARTARTPRPGMSGVFAGCALTGAPSTTQAVRGTASVGRHQPTAFDDRSNAAHKVLHAMINRRRPNDFYGGNTPSRLRSPRYGLLGVAIPVPLSASCNYSRTGRSFVCFDVNRASPTKS